MCGVRLLTLTVFRLQTLYSKSGARCIDWDDRVRDPQASLEQELQVVVLRIERMAVCINHGNDGIQDLPAELSQPTRQSVSGDYD